MKNIVWFREISKNDVGTVGGKGASLGEMANHNFPIPPGFVVTADAYFEFIEESGLRKKLLETLKGLDVENTSELEKASKEIREMIVKEEIPEELQIEIKKAYNALGEKRIAWITSKEAEYVAVRSSATAEDSPANSFAGQMETYLNIRGANDVIESVRNCWSSLFTPRAIYYRAKNKFRTETVGIAVVVQKMVNSMVAGVMFTAEPTGNRGKIIIEAVYGLGETIVGGFITPDHYEVDKGRMKILTKTASQQEWMLIRAGRGNKREDVPKKNRDKQKLNDKQIIELAKMGKQIENHYKYPQDIEFAVEGKEIFIVQSRPITTLPKEEKKEAGAEGEAGRKGGIKEPMVKDSKGDIVHRFFDGTAGSDRGMEGSGREVITKGLGASPGIGTGKVKVVGDVKEIRKVLAGDILVTKMTSPDWVPTMRKAAAIVTDEGGLTCHAAIVSRELGIPCVVGTENGTEVLNDGMEVSVDGRKGLVYRGIISSEAGRKEEGGSVKEASESAEEVEEEIKEEIEKAVEKAEESAPKSERAEIEEKARELLRESTTKVKVNVALPEAAEKAAATGAAGVGLLRAEHMITKSGEHPAEFARRNELEKLTADVKEGIKAVAGHFKGKPVWYRTFDARTDEFRELKGGGKEPHEDNPMLGWHGIRRDLDEPELLRAQFNAVKQLVDEGFGNIGIMLPFVQSVEEVRKAKEIARSCGLEPDSKELEFGVMIETPAAVWIIDELIAEGIDFVSFGTNDLTQLTLGVDRNNGRIQKLFNELHPAVIRQIKYVVGKCKGSKVEASICGQAASNPEMVRQLVRFGINSVSANIDAVENIRKVVAEEEKRIVLEGLRKIGDK